MLGSLAFTNPVKEHVVLLDPLEAILRDYSGYVPFGLMTTSSDGSQKLDNTTWFLWPDEKAEIEAFCTKYEDTDVYYSPQLYSRKTRKKEYVKHTPVLYADADGAQPEKFTLSPSFVVETSPNHYHLYWMLNEEVPVQWTEAANRRIYNTHKDIGCDSGWALTKYLRVPGTTNTKYESIHKVTFIPTGTIYDKAEFIAAYGDPESLTDIVNSEEIPDDVPDAKTVIINKLRGQMNDYVKKLITVEPAEGKWSDNIWALELALFRLRLSPVDVFAIVKDSACNKYARDNRPELELWSDVLNAEKKYKSEVTIVSADSMAETNALISSRPNNVKHTIRIITDEERKLITKDTFIDEYKTWAIEQTNADPKYHELSAMCLLSTVLSDFGHAVPQHGALRLHMWFMILGVTSRTYKTTAKNMMLRVLNPLCDDNYEYDLGSDATSEGLLEDLAARPRRSALFYRDEAQEMIVDSKGGKGYMSGFIGVLTEIYDGFVKGRTRAGGKKTKSAETSMSLYLMGVPEKMSDALTSDDFASGFLPRMIFCLGKPGEKEPVRQAEQLSKVQKNGTILFVSQSEIDVQKLQNRLASMRTFWANKLMEVNREPGKTIPITVETAAWNRWTEASDLIEEEATACEDNSMMLPVATRMGTNILKLSCLLAMAECKDKVSMKHVLTALQYAEVWYEDVLTMTSMVHSSTWSRNVNEVYEFVIEKGNVSISNVFKKFMKKHRPKDLREIIESLEASNLIRKVTVEGNSEDMLVLV